MGATYRIPSDIKTTKPAFALVFTLSLEMIKAGITASTRSAQILDADGLVEGYTSEGSLTQPDVVDVDGGPSYVDALAGNPSIPGS